MFKIFILIIVFSLSLISENKNIYSKDTNSSEPEGNVSYEIRGYVVEHNGNAFLQVSVSNGFVSVGTNNNGEFVFKNLTNESYTLTPISKEYYFLPEFSIVEGRYFHEVNFVAIKHNSTFLLSGAIFNSTNPRSSENISVSNGDTIVKTNTDGRFQFNNLSPGSYTITPTHSSLTFNPTYREVNLIYSEFYANFGANIIKETFKISGKIQEEGKDLYDIKLSNGLYETFTFDYGTYSFYLLDAGSYTITPISDEYEFSPKYQIIELDKDKDSVNFTAKKKELSVSKFDNEALKVYPQPSNGEFSVKLNAEINSTLRIYDVNGLLIFESKLNRNYKNEDLKIKLDNISNGVYIIELNKGNEIITNNLLIEK